VRRREQITDQLRDNVWESLNGQLQYQIEPDIYNRLHDVLCEEKRYRLISQLYLYLRTRVN
jgi:hypothetical protein